MTGEADLRAAGFPGGDCPQMKPETHLVRAENDRKSNGAVRDGADFAPTGCIRVSLGMHGIKISQFSIFCSQISDRYAILGAEGGERMQRLIFHVDVNSAFLSWEAARALRRGGRSAAHPVRHRRRPGQAHRHYSGKIHPRKGLRRYDRRAGRHGAAQMPAAGAGSAGFPAVFEKTPKRSSPSAAATRPLWSRCPSTNASST